LHGCQIVNFPMDWSDKKIGAALVKEADDEMAHSKCAYWFD
jgi:hypothetical protein